MYHSARFARFAYYSKKLNIAQHNYTTTEKDLLAIVVTLEEFCSMLLGTKLIIYTDHHNFTFDGTLNSQRVLHWCIYAEEYGPSTYYIPGQKNSIVGIYSCLPHMDSLDTKGKDLDDQVINNGSLFYSPFESSEFPQHRRTH